MERSSEARLPAQGTNPAVAEAASAPSRHPAEAAPMSRISQETIAIIGVGIALGALILTTTGGLRDELRAFRAEAHADREAIRAEAHADREAIRAEGHAYREAIRAEGRADREAIRAEARADRETFEEQIIRLTEQQGALGGLIEGLRQRPPTAGASSDRPAGCCGESHRGRGVGRDAARLTRRNGRSPVSAAGGSSGRSDTSPPAGKEAHHLSPLPEPAIAA